MSIDPRAKSPERLDAPAEEIKILDVIITTSTCGFQQTFVVVDRSPAFVYRRGESEPSHGWHRHQHRLTAHDSGFYSFMVERPGSTDAFAGRKFTISLDDGGTLECNGQVWDEMPPERPEPTVQVGVATIEQLEKCYCFFGGRLSAARLNDWLASNRPSKNYRKYDPRHTLADLDKRWADNSLGRKVSPARARKLRKRGVTVRLHDGVRSWSPWYERQKAKILADIALDQVAP